MSGPRAAPESGQDGALSSLERADLTRMRSSLAALHEVAFAAGGAPDLATLTGLAVDHARALLDADGAFLSRLEDDGTLRRLATAHRDGHSWMPADLKIGQGVAGRSFQSRTPLLVRDYAAWEHARPESIGHIGSAIAAPLLAGNAAVGVLGVTSVERERFTEEDLRLLSLFAAELAPNIALGTAAARSEARRVEAQALAEALRESEARLRAVVDQALDAHVTVDAGGLITAWNPQAEVTFGWARDEAIGRRVHEVLVPPRHRAAFAAGMRDYLAGGPARLTGKRTEKVGLRRDGREIPIELSVSAIRTGTGDDVAFSAFIRDITPRRELEAELRRLALHDSLTGLPNRALFGDRLSHALASAGRNGTPLALLLVDLDEFKEVNDALGHPIGDALLVRVGARLSELLRDDETVARLGGDEFAVVLPSTDAVGAALAAARLIVALEREFDVDGQALDVSASVGVAVHPEHGLDAATLLRHADIALYHAKRTGGGYAAYDPTEQAADPARLGLIADLRRALASGDIRFEYQPVIDCRTGAAVGVEALARWTHESRGPISPAEFIPLAESSGLIKPLTELALATAIAQCARWHQAGHALVVGVNLSARSILDPELPELVERLLVEHEIPAGALELEITESALVADSRRATGALERLRSLGARLLIDDFGTGYSSLAYLRRFPVDGIKIDRSFMQHLRDDESTAMIVRTTVELGHGLGLRVTAEGVEDGDTLAAAVAIGCDAAQGFHMARPMPAAEIDRWLEESPFGARAIAV